MDMIRRLVPAIVCGKILASEEIDECDKSLAFHQDFPSQ